MGGTPSVRNLRSMAPGGTRQPEDGVPIYIAGFARQSRYKAGYKEPMG